LNQNTKTYKRPKPPKPLKKADKMLTWFKGRGISSEVITRNKILMTEAYMPAKGEVVNCIAFPYFNNDELVNVKYRDAEKNFTQEKDAEKIFYGQDDCWGKDVVYIVEGEIDKLSLEQVGFTECISTPDGAPDPESRNFPKKFSFIEGCEGFLNSINTFVFAVDNDAPGHLLQAELIRRLGPEKCYTVTWPDGIKDANECLVKKGEKILKDILYDIHPVPVEGIFEVKDLDQAIDDLYENGLKCGEKTGWLNVDEFYTVKTGLLTIVTGIPSHGKSEVVDALMVNLAENIGWNFAIFSPENQPLQRHMAKLIQKRCRKPFAKGASERITRKELAEAKAWIQDHFQFILPPEDELNIDGILTKAKIAVTRYGIKGMVIDPWNELDHSRPNGMREDEHISDCLSKVRRFTRKYDVHIWIVAHPTKLQKVELVTASGDRELGYPVPTLYDISGGAHWYNKADNGLTVYRDVKDESSAVQLHIQKIRFREDGKPGLAELNYDPMSGRYTEAYSILGG
jgi:twinkle protein